MTKHWTYRKPTGEVVESANKAWTALQGTYAPFKDHAHNTQDIIVWEIDGGWQMYAVANVWYNMQAPGDDETEGLDGKQWDGVMKGCFKYTFRKGGERDVELARTEIYSDP